VRGKRQEKGKVRRPFSVLILLLLFLYGKGCKPPGLDYILIPGGLIAAKRISR
jgi:hypothetical protein